MKEYTIPCEDHRRQNWLSLIQQLLTSADADQLRDIYHLLRGFLGNPRD